MGEKRVEGKRVGEKIVEGKRVEGQMEGWGNNGEC